MKILPVIVILIVLCGICAFAESQPQSQTPAQIGYPTQKPTNSNQNKIEYDKRGTKEYPLIVETLQRESDTAEKKQEANQHEKDTSISWKIMLFTGGIMAIAIFQLGFFYWQLKLMRKSVKDTEKAANAAMISADSVKESERPYIFIRVEGTISKSLDEGLFTCKAGFYAINHGKTPAILTNVNGRLWCGNLNETPPTISGTTGKEIPSGGSVIGSNISDSFPTELKITELQAKNIEGANLKLLCYGRIDYKDIFSKTHYTKFCWEFQNRSDKRGFYLSDNKELNDYS